MLKEYRIIKEICKKRIVVAHVDGVSCNDFAQIFIEKNECVWARVIEIEFDRMHLQLYGSALGLKSTCKIRFYKPDSMLPLTFDVLGRVLDGMGNPKDGKPELLAQKHMSIFARSLNPLSRDTQPHGLYLTDIPSVDAFCPIVKGHKTAVVSFNSFTMMDFVSNVIIHALATKEVTEQNFALVLSLVGMSNIQTSFLLEQLEQACVKDRTVVFHSSSIDTAFDKVASANAAVSTANFLALEKGMDVLTVIIDTKNYLDAGRLLAKEGGCDFDESSFLTSLLDGAGKIRSKDGSVSIVTCFSQCDNHDLVKKTCDGNIFLSQEAKSRGMSVPVDIVGSYARLNGVKSEASRLELANRFKERYIKGRQAYNMLGALGEQALSLEEKEQLKQFLELEGQISNRVNTDSLIILRQVLGE